MPNNSYSIQDTQLLSTHMDREYVLRINDLPEEEKPREKLEEYGPSNLSSAELLAIVLMQGTKKEGVLEMSHRLLKEYGEKAILHETDVKKLEKALDVPYTKACQIVACFELGRRFYKKQPGGPIFVRTASQVHEYTKDMRELPKEHLRGLYLNSHYRLVYEETISIGSLTANVVHPREVFRPALEYAASAVILVHNHPSGVADPSPADVEITKQLVEAGNILGIRLLDHVIVTKDSYVSIAVDYE